MPQANTHRNTCDPAVVASQEIKRLQARYNEIEGRPTPIGMEEAYREGERKDVFDRICILRDFLSATKAKSIAGAVAQIAEVFSICDTMSGSGYEPEEKAREYRKINRLLFSADAVFRDHLPSALAESLEPLGANLNPWCAYESRIERVKAMLEAA